MSQDSALTIIIKHANDVKDAQHRPLHGSNPSYASMEAVEMDLSHWLSLRLDLKFVQVCKLQARLHLRVLPSK